MYKRVSNLQIYKLFVLILNNKIYAPWDTNIRNSREMRGSRVELISLEEVDVKSEFSITHLRLRSKYFYEVTHDLPNTFFVINLLFLWFRKQAIVYLSHLGTLTNSSVNFSRFFKRESLWILEAFSGSLRECCQVSHNHGSTPGSFVSFSESWNPIKFLKFSRTFKKTKICYRLV